MARYSELSPTELVRACAGSSDAEAWFEFIRRFRPVIGAAVLRTARRFGEPSSALQDDLIQDTYVKLCEDESRMLHSFRPQHEDSIFAFLKVVASNVTLDHYKSALAGKRGAAQTEAIDEAVHGEPKTPARAQEAEGAMVKNLQLQEIDEILQEVTQGKDGEKKRTIFWLRHRQGLTASEIASLPGIGLTTEGVESVLLRLTNMIRSHMEEKESEAGSKLDSGS